MSSFKKFDPADLPVDASVLESTPIKGELNIESLVFRQIERTYMSALQDESLFASNVRLLLSTIPKHKREEVLALSEEYTSVNTQYQYKYCCGVAMGTPDHPVSGSPMLVEDEVIDWHKLFEIILASLEEIGISWKYDQSTIEVGGVPSEKPMPVPTPVFTASFTPQPLGDQVGSPTPEAVNGGVPTEKAVEKPKYQRPCAICSQHVSPGTGQFYMHRVVHKETCLDMAKVKWVGESKGEVNGNGNGDGT